MAGAVDYFTHCDSTGQHDLWLGEAEHDRGAGYLTDLISRRAAEFVGAQAGEAAPFFLSVHYTAPHWPWETRDDAEADAPLVKNNLFDLDGGNIAHLSPHDPSHGRGHRPDRSGARERRASPTTRWSSSPATTAASGSRTTGRWSAARWT